MAQEATFKSPKRQRWQQGMQELLGSFSRRLFREAAVPGPGALAERLECSMAVRGWARTVSQSYRSRICTSGQHSGLGRPVL